MSFICMDMKSLCERILDIDKLQLLTVIKLYMYLNRSCITNIIM